LHWALVDFIIKMVDFHQLTRSRSITLSRLSHKTHELSPLALSPLLASLLL